jgi:hypothetical protein
VTNIERTAYPRFVRAPSAKTLRELYTPTPGDAEFVAATARGEPQKLALMILLKVRERLGYFPKPEAIPQAMVIHIRRMMRLPDDLLPDINSSHTLYRYHAQIRAHLEAISESKQVRHVAAGAMHAAAQVMNDPADLISAAVEILVKEHCELPAFGTLDRMAGRIRTLVHNTIYARIQVRLSEGEQRRLERLLEPGSSSAFTDLNRIKEALKAPR